MFLPGFRRYRNTETLNLHVFAIAINRSVPKITLAGINRIAAKRRYLSVF